jgi:hypothetical protein
MSVGRRLLKALVERRSMSPDTGLLRSAAACAQRHAVIPTDAACGDAGCGSFS